MKIIPRQYETSLSTLDNLDSLCYTDVKTEHRELQQNGNQNNMAKEIERKFLVNVNKIDFRKAKSVQYIQQYYLLAEEDVSIRLRVISNPRNFEQSAYLTIKTGKGLVRYETEFFVNCLDVVNLIQISKKMIEKTRYYFDDGWTLDDFRNGLLLAEKELAYKEQEIILPDFVTEEVTDNPEYYNVNM